MAQAAAATGLIHGAVAATPASGSQRLRVEKLRPDYGFEAKVLGRTEKKSRRGAGVRSELQVIPVSAEDVPKVSRLCAKCVYACDLRLVVLWELMLISRYTIAAIFGKNGLYV